MSDVHTAYFDQFEAAKKGGRRVEQVVNKEGNLQRVWKGTRGLAEDAYNAGKGMAGKGMRTAEGLAVGTANNAGKGIRSGGNMVAGATDRLAGAIRRNPKVAGAVILGGTLVGAGGGAYALSRRNGNN